MANRILGVSRSAGRHQRSLHLTRQGRAALVGRRQETRVPRHLGPRTPAHENR